MQCRCSILCEYTSIYDELWFISVSIIFFFFTMTFRRPHVYTNNNNRRAVFRALSSDGIVYSLYIIILHRSLRRSVYDSKSLCAHKIVPSSAQRYSSPLNIIITYRSIWLITRYIYITLFLKLLFLQFSIEWLG
jgi:hypothetical protein